MTAKLIRHNWSLYLSVLSKNTAIVYAHHKGGTTCAPPAQPCYSEAVSNAGANAKFSVLEQLLQTSCSTPLACCKALTHGASQYLQVLSLGKSHWEQFWFWVARDGCWEPRCLQTGIVTNTEIRALSWDLERIYVSVLRTWGTFGNDRKCRGNIWWWL